jgi:predicted 3-demethylubiquinone-9 3-methyltransferase (glyoxalase superfamily)
LQKITPFLWFDGNAEEAVNFYVSLFKNSRVVSITRYSDDFPDMKGKVLTAVFELASQQFMAIDGGPEFKFTEAISLHVNCEGQEEVDRLWDKLTADGGAESQCGWLKDKYGLSWQIIPTILGELLSDKDAQKAGRVMQAMLKMRKIEIKPLNEAYEEG